MSRAATAAAAVQGVWRRRSRSFGDGPDEEVSDVLWVQVGSWFADVRVPRVLVSGEMLDAAQAFSGTVSCDGPTVTWRHDLDTMGRPAGHEDRASIEVDGSVLIERGPGYVEFWENMAAGAPGAVLERRDPGDGGILARVVSCGDHTVAVWASPASGGTAVQWSQEGRPACGWTVGTGQVPWAALASAASLAVSPPPGWVRVDTEAPSGAVG